MSDETENHDGDPIEPANETRADTHTTPKRWVKGMESPNKAGRPRTPKNIAELRELAREKTGAMLEFLANTALNAKAPIGVRVTAATEILNRGWGRPNQSLDLNHGVQDNLAALLEEIDARNKAKLIEGPIVGPALAIEQPLLDHGQDGPQDSIPVELGAREPDE
jgi:hypothetical protein